jgi:hypothetical protein
MHLSNKIQFTLDELFASFNVQQIALADKNISATYHCLDSSGHQLLTLMHDKKISYDEFLANRCLPLIRFYLAPINIQRETFLSEEKLMRLFNEIPTVEAYLFKKAMELALQYRKNMQHNTLPIAHLPVPNELSNPAHPKKAIYANHVYCIQSGYLEICDNPAIQQQNLLSYTDLSPLQQLEAQKICKEKYNLISA